MSDADLYISNGNCYYGEGQISDPRFIPCGNAAVAGTQSCCYQGDFCLSTAVCYDNDTSVTYIAGCTDATYSSSRCPHKPGYPDQQWVALARCDGDDIDLFSGCAHHTDEVQIKHEDCTCDAASALISNPASGQPTLNQIGLLPTTAGGTISFNPTALPTATASDPGSGGLSHSGKVGVGVGVGVGVPVILAAVIFSFLFLRRRKKAKQQQRQLQPGAPETGQHPFGPAHQSSPPPVYSPELPSTQPGWVQGYKPELHGESAHKSELPTGDKEVGMGVGMNSVQNTPHDHYPPSELASDGYEDARSRRETASSVTPSFISPQSTGNTEQQQQQQQSWGGGGGGPGHARTGSSNMDPISEYRTGKP